MRCWVSSFPRTAPARGRLVRRGRTHEGKYRIARWSFSNAPFRIRRHAPRLGEHTAEVLAEIGMSDEEIARVGAPQPPQDRPDGAQP
jgi:crotonobetainyl-CoA:carnitine CoA-transferase CaiB-like acyl-CoA transferase